MKAWKWMRKLGGTADHRRVIGRKGERRAARYLRRRRYRILHRNLTIAKDEADLVALDPDGCTIVIVEVKTRRSGHVAPEANISREKRYRLARLAAKLQRMKSYAGRPFRFDVVTIIWPEGGRPEVKHYAGAFESPF